MNGTHRAAQEKCKEILKNYSPKDAKLIHDTIEELCAKGIAKGCYQDMGVLCDLLSIMGAFESEVKHKEDKDNG